MVKRKRTYNILMFITGITFGAIMFCSGAYAATVLTASGITYVDNANLNASNVQSAIDGTCTKFSNQLDGITSKVRKELFPVGSIYVSVVNKNPSSIFGGTWSRYAQGKTLVGVNENESEFNTVNKTGGAKTHTLTINEMPAHEGHLLSNNYNWGGTVGYYLNVTQMSVYGSSGRGWSKIHGNEMAPASYSRGGSKPHNNLQPYITVYMWRRVS